MIQYQAYWARTFAPCVCGSIYLVLVTPVCNRTATMCQVRLPPFKAYRGKKKEKGRKEVEKKKKRRKKGKKEKRSGRAKILGGCRDRHSQHMHHAASIPDTATRTTYNTTETPGQNPPPPPPQWRKVQIGNHKLKNQRQIWRTAGFSFFSISETLSVCFGWLRRGSQENC